MIKSKTITSYLQELSALLAAVQVTDLQGNPVEFEEGMQKAIGWIHSLRSTAKKILLIGNGGSAAIASHEALDFWNAGGIRAMAFNDPVQLTCMSNDFGYEQVFVKPIEMFAEAGDILIAVSSSGCSPNILKGVEAARGKGCLVFTFSGFAGENPLRLLGDLNFYLPSKSYGHVEVAHLALIHSLADSLGANNGGFAPEP